ncbi:MAG: IclR family transcriptional regulator [Bacillota bacterium]|nr:IclR family transcriptional regulator [Bacillota bacterium]
MFNDNPPAVERAIQILELIATSTNSLSLKELSDQLEIPSASAYRIVKCLQGYGYIREAQFESNKYRLGYKISFLAENMNADNDLIYIAKPYLQNLSEKTGHACQLGILLSDCATIIDQAIPKNSITIIAKFWENIPINISASGKLLTAMMPTEERKAFIAKAWKLVSKVTPYTVTDMNYFLKEIDTIRGQQYATDFEEYSIGIGCIAVPVYDYTNNAIAALGLTGHIIDYKDKEQFEFMLNLLRQASKEVSEKLGNMMRVGT